MAALMRHGVFKTVQHNPKFQVISALFATKAEKKKGMDRKQPPRIYSTGQSIAAKGFLRPQKSYLPSGATTAKLESIFEETLGTTDLKSPLGTAQAKFELFTICAKEFDHSIPNSLLHTIETLNDVKNFYETPIDTITPLDKMRNMDLPENLHVQFDYHRFHPDTDTKFKGQTAFNRSSTLVTGLKYKDKYRGHNQNQVWPYNS